MSRLIPADFPALIESRGAAFIERSGEDQVRNVILDIMCGVNIRASTEAMTRLRLGRINAATFVFYCRGIEAARSFSQDLPAYAFRALTSRASRVERELAKWTLGLTGKAYQNVLRDDANELKRYIASFSDSLARMAGELDASPERLSCRVERPNATPIELGWHDLLSLFCTIGSQTLAIRGSEKSTYGKLFERLVLGATLHALGFDRTDFPPDRSTGVYWLSSRHGEREADAPLLVAPGRAVRFDMGFIGRGNPEITKDKISRVEREIEGGAKRHDSATCVIVDRIGERSGLDAQAKRIGAKVIQMSMSYWPIDLAQWLCERFDHDSDIARCRPERLRALLTRRLAKLSISSLI